MTERYVFEIRSSVTRYTDVSPSKWAALVAFAEHLGIDAGHIGIDNENRIVDRDGRGYGHVVAHAVSASSSLRR